MVWPALCLLVTAAVASDDVPRFRGPFLAGDMAEPANGEASGLAASRRAADLLWTHNDSGGVPVLFALGTNGRLRGQLRIEGVKNVDWEDLAAAVVDGRPMLVVGDTGDNSARYPQRVLHVVAEPDPATLAPGKELVSRPEFSIHYRYDDGPRDAEGVAIDADEHMIYVLSKREAQPHLYQLPWRAASADQPAIARRVGILPHLPQPTGFDQLVRDPHHAFRGWPTALDFSSDGRLAVVLLYSRPLLFPRAPGESWADALAREPVALAPHALPQAEGACFTRDGTALYVCSEKATRLLRYDRR
ncbi:MAG TPA: hypothetical protein VHD61_13000 [Lacunisphaera sp.]|nr:hypothetical protein [Lacunisphaera sp.]